ncbi:hypothetical protein VTK73DRAFT_5755 [Phialemonium thermophilum]|uniref:Uncharacterized protein n=1 Tax=Phialemonium thermophilum TaxID=223376 RepID=A0ABR3V0L0_9PEZI
MKSPPKTCCRSTYGVGKVTECSANCRVAVVGTPILRDDCFCGHWMIRSRILSDGSLGKSNPAQQVAGGR